MFYVEWGIVVDDEGDLDNLFSYLCIQFIKLFTGASGAELLSTGFVMYLCLKIHLICINNLSRIYYACCSKIQHS